MIKPSTKENLLQLAQLLHQDTTPPITLPSSPTLPPTKKLPTHTSNTTSEGGSTTAPLTTTTNRNHNQTSLATSESEIPDIHITDTSSTTNQKKYHNKSPINTPFDISTLPKVFAPSTSPTTKHQQNL